MADTAAVPSLNEFKPEAWRGAPGGYRVGQTRTGAWWWVDPEQRPFFGCGVERVRTVGASGVQSLLLQVQEWRFNLLAADADPAFHGRGVPHLISLELRRSAENPIRVGGANLPDVFDPRWSARCVERVAAINSGRGLAGYVSDLELRWAQPPADGSTPTRPSLLQLCLALDARFAAYHAAWEFALAPYGGELGALARAWEVSLPNKETLRQLTIDEQPLGTDGYLRDQDRFTREFAQRYFRAVAEAVRQADPGRLYLGAPVAAGENAEVRRAAAAHAHVLMTDAPPAESAGPVFVTGFNWDAVVDDPPPGASAFEHRIQQGRQQLEALATHPAVIGYSWREHVQGDRLEEAPFARGLLYDDGSVAHEHVQPLAAFNAHAAALRAERLC